MEGEKSGYNLRQRNRPVLVTKPKPSVRKINREIKKRAESLRASKFAQDNSSSSSNEDVTENQKSGSKPRKPSETQENPPDVPLTSPEVQDTSLFITPSSVQSLNLGLRDSNAKLLIEAREIEARTGEKQPPQFSKPGTSNQENNEVSQNLIDTQEKHQKIFKLKSPKLKLLTRSHETELSKQQRGQSTPELLYLHDGESGSIGAAGKPESDVTDNREKLQFILEQPRKVITASFPPQKLIYEINSPPTVTTRDAPDYSSETSASSVYHSDRTSLQQVFIDAGNEHNQLHSDSESQHNTDLEDNHEQVMAEAPAPDNTLLAAIALRPTSFNGLHLDKSQRWWNSFSRYANFSQFQGETKARLLGMLLTGSALLWYESLPEATQNDFDLVAAAFREKFIVPSRNQLQHQIEALQRQQKSTELVEEFAAETKSRLANHGYNANQQMTIILNGLRPEIKSVVMQHLPFENTEQLITKAKHVEQALKSYVQGNLAPSLKTEENKEVKSAIDKLTANVTAMQRGLETGRFQQRGRGRGVNRAHRPPQQQQQQQQPQKRCFVCFSSNHLQRNCPQNQLTPNSGCFKCGDAGHFQRECPRQNYGRQNYRGRGSQRGFGRNLGTAGARRWNGGSQTQEWTPSQPWQQNRGFGGRSGRGRARMPPQENDNQWGN